MTNEFNEFDNWTDEEKNNALKRLQQEVDNLRALSSPGTLSKVEQVRAWKCCCPICNGMQVDPRKWNGLNKKCLVCGKCYLWAHYLGLESHDECKQVWAIVLQLKSQRK